MKRRLYRRIYAFVMGWREGLGDFGITWNDDPNDYASVAYDRGRNLRRRVWGIE